MQVVKTLPADTGDARDAGAIPGSGRSPWEGNDNPLQYSCLDNFMDRGAWRATVFGVTKNQTGLSTHTHTLRCVWIIYRSTVFGMKNTHLPPFLMASLTRCWFTGVTAVLAALTAAFIVELPRGILGSRLGVTRGWGESPRRTHALPSSEWLCLNKASKNDTWLVHKRPGTNKFNKGTYYCHLLNNPERWISCWSLSAQ